MTTDKTRTKSFAIVIEKNNKMAVITTINAWNNLFFDNIEILSDLICLQKKPAEKKNMLLRAMLSNGKG